MPRRTPAPRAAAASPKPESAAFATRAAFTALAMLSTLALLTATACGGGADASPDTAIPPVPVTLANVEQRAVAQPIVATGTFGTKDDIALSFKVGGVVARLTVDEGTTVRRGQLLASLDLREIDAMVTKARAAADKAARDVKRLQALYTDSVATYAQLQDAETGLAAAQADLDAAMVNREYAVITSPVDGQVQQRRLNAGSLVSPGQEVLVLGSSRRGRVVRVGLTDRDAVRVARGDSAEITFDALPGDTFRGVVSQIGVATNVRTGTVPVEVTVTGADRLPSGTVARVQLAARASSTVTLVPIEALVEADGDSATVYTVREGNAARHQVHIAFLAGAQVAVTGLDNETRVVTAGASYLAHGVAVRVIDGPLNDGAPGERALAGTDR